jgi:uncharacterized damage-inducible protein DinB
MFKPVPLFGEEKESLVVSLERHREVVRWKTAGLTDEQLRQPLTPSGLTLLGLVKHLAAMEYGWFCVTFDRKTEPLPLDENDVNADLRIEPGETTAGIFAFYDRACDAADAVIEELPLDATGTAWFGETVSMRWVLIHMLEEVARHAGHVDVMREQLDGLVGDHDRG